MYVQISKLRMANNLEELPAVELLKTKVKVVNNLNDKISEVQVCYAESSKGRGASYLYNFRTVDIESEESINWKNVLNLGEIQSLHDFVSTENVYFGNNRGYWQVYFNYRGNDYKINKNNANFNLEKKDQEKPVVIEILKKEYTRTSKLLLGVTTSGYRKGVLRRQEFQ